MQGLKDDKAPLIEAILRALYEDVDSLQHWSGEIAPKTYFECH
jgi:hypothetical protein